MRKNLKNMLVIGGGGHAKVVIEAILASGEWSELAVLDDKREQGDQILDVPVIGKASEISRYIGNYSDVIVAIGDVTARLQYLEVVARYGIKPSIIIHPKAYVAADASLGEGTVVMAGAIINSGVHVGYGCIINTGAIVDHDCELGNGVHVCPGSSLAGGVAVGARSWIGIGSSVIQNVRIGSECLVGGGAAVIDDIPDRTTVVGVPAKPISLGTNPDDKQK